MLKETIFLAGLLHYIGKFTERSKSYPVDEKFKRVNTGHPKYSAQLLETLSKRNPLFMEQDKVSYI